MEIVYSDVGLTDQEFGEGICRFIGWQMGYVYFPYRIIRSSYKVPEELHVTLDQEPTELPITINQTKDDGVYGRRFKLSQSEIVQAIAFEVCFKQHTHPKNNRVSTMPAGIPDSLEFELAYIPRGASTEESLHEFNEF